MRRAKTAIKALFKKRLPPHLQNKKLRVDTPLAIRTNPYTKNGWIGCAASPKPQL